MRYIPLFFLLGFALELLSLLWVGSRIGILATLLLVIGSGMAGLSVIRITGLRLSESLRVASAGGRGLEIKSSAVFAKFLAAILLIIPGFVSDVIALFLLFGPTRRWLRQWLNGWIMFLTPEPGYREGHKGNTGVVIDGEASEVHDDALRGGRRFPRGTDV
ncbi:MAG: FxsA family protein [Alphaproteobacteria bacterium]|nr:FxsA family protein [Alphaproteobacteria bacterium]